MDYREPKTPDEIRAMTPGELLDWVKRPSQPTESAPPPERSRCPEHGIYLWPEGVECPACVHAERDRYRAALEAIIAHHEDINAKQGRPRDRSHTIRLAEYALNH